MYRSLKLMHVVGFAMFLGSILAHIVTGRTQAGAADPSFVLYARETICLATRTLTVPGLILVIGSGLGMVWLTRGELLRQRWLKLHIALAAAIAATTVAIVVAVANLTFAARALSRGGGLEAFVVPEAVERYAGAVNILMILLVAGIGLLRPRLQARRVARVAE